MAILSFEPYEEEYVIWSREKTLKVEEKKVPLVF